MTVHYASFLAVRKIMKKSTFFPGKKVNLNFMKKSSTFFYDFFVKIREIRAVMMLKSLICKETEPATTINVTISISF